MRPGHKGRRGQKTTQFIDRASKIVIQTKNVRESLYQGLRDHIELLLRKYRAQEDKGNNNRPRKMPSPGFHESKKRNNRKGKKGKKMKQRSQKKILQMLRAQQKNDARRTKEPCAPC